MLKATRCRQVVDIDPHGHPNTPWLVNVSYGSRVYETLEVSRRDLNPDGTVWVTHKDAAGIGAPAVSGLVPRFHFDDLGHSLVTNFQVLTTANWNDDLYDVVASTGPASSIYFYAVIVIGNWMLLNLFIAILIQGFAEQKAVRFCPLSKLLCLRWCWRGGDRVA